MKVAYWVGNGGNGCDDNGEPDVLVEVPVMAHHPLSVKKWDRCSICKTKLVPTMCIKCGTYFCIKAVNIKVAVSVF